MVKQIPLQNGMFALVDDEDYERVKCRVWSAIQNTVNVMDVQARLSYKHAISLGQEIMRCKGEKDKCVVRINTDELDFRKSNLKIVTKSDGVHLTKRSKVGSTSKYRGVGWHKQSKKWRARLKNTELGLFDNEDEAAMAWNKAAFQMWGELAYQNIIGEDTREKKLVLDANQTTQRRFNKEKKNSKFLGVSQREYGYTAKITNNYKVYYLGHFKTEIDAAKAYDEKAKELFGDKAVLNFPDSK